MSKFIKNSIRLLIAVSVIIVAIFMTFFVLIITTTLAFILALSLWWKQTTPSQKSFNKQSTRTIIDADYTVVEK